MQTYLDILRHILDRGTFRKNRTGVDTIGVFGHQARFDLRDRFPLLTTKRIFFRGVVVELLWFLSGDTNAKTLQDQGVHIWDEWATAEQTAKRGREEGDLGPVYGWAWRHFGGDYSKRAALHQHGTGPRGDAGFDQIAWLLDEITTNPNSRRLIVSGWNPDDAQRVALPPCHTLFQFYVSGQELSCHLYARSIDAFLGLPFNIASYALLTHIIAHVTGLTPGDLVISFGDLHLYENHLEQVGEQLRREPRTLPRVYLKTNPVVSPLEHLLSIRPHQVCLEDYEPHPAIKAPVAV